MSAVQVVVVSDRPADLYLHGCLDNLRDYLPVDTTPYVVDDTEHRLGMAGAVRAGFDAVLASGADYALWIEEDFRLIDLPLRAMQWILDHCPHLAQVVLKRQPWSVEEQRAGGQIETNPTAYTQCSAFDTNVHWCEHSTLFSVNPCLIPRRTLELAWNVSHPGGVERAITDACTAEGLRFAYFGKLDEPSRCEHVGHIRAASGWRW